LPEDISALRAVAREYDGYEPVLLDAAVVVNERQLKQVILKLQRELHTLKGKRIAALGRRLIAPNAVAVLEEVGIYPEPHRARQVSRAMIEEAALVLAMSPRHAATLRRLSGESPAEILTLSEYATGVPDQEGVPDPYGLTMAAHRSTLHALYEHVERVVGHLRG
jgi:protein-tyrosine-phosphatase